MRLTRCTGRLVASLPDSHEFQVENGTIRDAHAIAIRGGCYKGSGSMVALGWNEGRIGEESATPRGGDRE